MRRSKNGSLIGILGNIGNGNLGDEATFSEAVRNIRQLIPDAKVYGFSDNPVESKKRHGICIFPVRVLRLSRKWDNKIAGGKSNEGGLINSGLYESVKSRLKCFSRMYLFLTRAKGLLSSFPGIHREIKFVIECIRIVRGTNMLIVPGSGHLSDHFGGPLNYPYSLFRWSLIARIAGAKMAFLSVGMGPLKSGLSRMLIRKALNLACYRSFRDEESRALAKSIGIKSRDNVMPDLAYSICPNKERKERIDTRKDGVALTVGLNVFPHFDERYWPVSDPGAYREYVEKISSFAAWLVKNGYRVLFFPTQIKADPKVIKDVKINLIEKINQNSREWVDEASVVTHNDLMDCLSRVDLVVATRFHGIIFSFLVGKPVLAIANHQKMKAVMRAMGLSDFVLDINQVRLEDLIGKFNSMKEKSEQIRVEIDKKTEKYRVVLINQYRHVLGLL